MFYDLKHLINSFIEGKLGKFILFADFLLFLSNVSGSINLPSVPHLNLFLTSKKSFKIYIFSL